jgi:ubiquinone/menaquinone biosynthesis C-methylase UbiE
MIETRDAVEKEGRERLYPSLRNPSYLVLSRRRKHFSAWLEGAVVPGATILDVGGRIQPYRLLLSATMGRYIAVDIMSSPLVDIRANAAALPIATESCDIVFCTQVLEYVPNPEAAVLEIYRVLKPGGIALLSFAAFYPRIAEDDHWRFLPSGLRFLLRPFREVEIVPEGTSISGFFRACCVCLTMFASRDWLREVVKSTVVPLLNLSGRLLESLSKSRNDQATGNYSVLARK